MSLLAFDMRPTIAALATESIKLMRFAAGTYDSNGRLVVGSNTITTVEVSLQPLSGKDLYRLPEGFQTAGVVAVWSPSELRTEDLIKTATGDQYQLEVMQDWNLAGMYYKAVGKKLCGAEVNSTLAAA